MLTTNNLILVLVLSVKKYLFSYILWYLEFHFDEMECCLERELWYPYLHSAADMLARTREQDYFI